MRSVVTDQGTAMYEATLCGECFTSSANRDYCESLAAMDHECSNPQRWEDSRGNEAVECVMCGRWEGHNGDSGVRCPECSFIVDESEIRPSGLCTTCDDWAVR